MIYDIWILIFLSCYNDVIDTLNYIKKYMKNVYYINLYITIFVNVKLQGTFVII